MLYSKKMLGRDFVRAGKGMTLVISNEDVDDIIRILKPLENSAVLIDGVNETIKNETKK